AEPPAEHLLGATGTGEQGIEVDAGGDPHLLEHRGEILRGDVAGGAGGHGTAAELAEARLETVDACSERGEHVGKPLTTRVVEVSGELHVAERGGPSPEQLFHLNRIGHTGSVAKADLLGAGVTQARSDLEDTLGRHVTLVRTAE